MIEYICESVTGNGQLFQSRNVGPDKWRLRHIHSSEFVIKRIGRFEWFAFHQSKWRTMISVCVFNVVECQAGCFSHSGPAYNANATMLVVCVSMTQRVTHSKPSHWWTTMSEITLLWIHQYCNFRFAIQWPILPNIFLKVQSDIHLCVCVCVMRVFTRLHQPIVPTVGAMMTDQKKKLFLSRLFTIMTSTECRTTFVECCLRWVYHTPIAYEYNSSDEKKMSAKVSHSRRMHQLKVSKPSAFGIHLQKYRIFFLFTDAIHSVEIGPVALCVTFGMRLHRQVQSAKVRWCRHLFSLLFRSLLGIFFLCCVLLTSTPTNQLSSIQSYEY